MRHDDDGEDDDDDETWTRRWKCALDMDETHQPSFAPRTRIQYHRLVSDRPRAPVPARTEIARQSRNSNLTSCLNLHMQDINYL